MTSPSHPLSYNTYILPEIKLSHHPASSPFPTPTILVILNRPEHSNAFTDTMVTSLVTAFDLLSTDPRVKCIVFTGSDPNNKVFCPGMDLSQAKAATAPGSRHLMSPETLERGRKAHRDGGGLVSLAIYRCRKPVVCALNGHAVGVGITMTLPCSMRIASARARVGFVFAQRGFSMEACSSFFLPRLVGAGRALQLVTTAATYPTTDPAVRDLFAEVVEPERVVPRALELAEEIGATTSAVSTRVMKDMIFRGPGSPEEAFRLESEVFYDMFRGADAREGISSFLEKREPRFEGKWEEEKPAAWPWWGGKEVKKEKGGPLEWLKNKL